MENPCKKDCPNRFVKVDENGKAINCHATCEAYIAYYEHRRFMCELKMQNETVGYLKETRKKRKSKWQKSKNNNV